MLEVEVPGVVTRLNPLKMARNNAKIAFVEWERAGANSRQKPANWGDYWPTTR